MASESPKWDDDASEQRFWGKVLRAVWTVLIITLVAGILAALTVALQWTPYLLLSSLGSLAGLALLVVLLGSGRSRIVTGFVLGVVTLPALAAWLTGVAATTPDRFAAYSAVIAPFVAYGSAVVCGGTAIAWLWRERPDRLAGGRVEPDQAQDKGGAA